MFPPSELMDARLELDLEARAAHCERGQRASSIRQSTLPEQAAGMDEASVEIGEDDDIELSPTHAPLPLSDGADLPAWVDPAATPWSSPLNEVHGRGDDDLNVYAAQRAFLERSSGRESPDSTNEERSRPSTPEPRPSKQRTSLGATMEIASGRALLGQRNSESPARLAFTKTSVPLARSDRLSSHAPDGGVVSDSAPNYRNRGTTLHVLSKAASGLSTWRRKARRGAAGR